MPDVSSADRASESAGRALPIGGLTLSRAGRLALAALGFIPLLHVLGVIAPLVAAANGGLSWPVAALLATGVLYLLPPLVVRITWAGRLPLARSDIGSSTFLWWWFSAQWQVIFSRLPMLEESLRIVPGLYSTWLRLWGARIGGLVYWSPGVRVLDRQWLRIGSRVVFGAGVRMNGHAIAQHRKESAALYLGTITIGDDVMVGGYSLLLPGCEIASGELTPPLRSVHPFSKWKGGRHVTNTEAGLTEALQ